MCPEGEAVCPGELGDPGVDGIVGVVLVANGVVVMDDVELLIRWFLD